jgi:hypothetical protein
MEIKITKSMGAAVRGATERVNGLKAAADAAKHAYEQALMVHQQFLTALITESGGNAAEVSGYELEEKDGGLILRIRTKE